MPRTIVCLLHPGPPTQGWIHRIWEWCLERVGWNLPRITGPVDQDPFFELSIAINEKMGRRYRCLPFIPKPGPTFDELSRELMPDDRVVMAIIEPQSTLHLRTQLMRRANKMVPGRACVFLDPLTQSEFWSEAQAWSHRMVEIARLQPLRRLTTRFHHGTVLRRSLCRYRPASGTTSRMAGS